MVTQQDDIGFAVGDRYHAERRVRHSPTGEVWRGRDPVLDRDVAITRIRAPRRPRRARRRALRRATAAARVALPGLVKVIDVIDGHDAVHVISEWLDADDLETRVVRDGPAPPAIVALWGLQLLGTLERVHAAEIVHGALTPRCIVIDDGAARLTDVCAAAFAGRSRPPSADGSLAFTAPEVVRGACADASSDLYGLGATLYFAVEGTPPFEAGGPVLRGTTAVAQVPRPMRRAGPLGALLLALLGTDPTARPSADEVRRGLTTVAGAGSPPRSAHASAGTGPDDTRRGADAEHVLQVAGRPATPDVAVADIDWSQVYAAMARDAAHRRRRIVVAVLALVLLLGGVAAVVGRDVGRRDVDLPMAGPPVVTVTDGPPGTTRPA